MKTLLVINSSGRITRSITRHLAQRFAEAWLAANPNGRIVNRDLLVTPPPLVNERWIAAVGESWWAANHALNAMKPRFETRSAPVHSAAIKEAA